MNEFDPKNDVIDRYLKGELREEALKSFEESLEHDADLRKIVEDRRLLYDVIVHYGQVELKNFLRRQTTHRRIFGISRKNIFYAAAALALILLASLALLLNIRYENEKNEIELTGQSKSDNKSIAKDNSTEQKTTTMSATDSNITSSNNNAGLPITDSTALLIAANVKVVSIDLPEYEYEEVVETAAMQRASVASSRYKKEARKAAESNEDVMAAELDTTSLVQKQVANKRLQSSIRMNMNFYNTNSGEKSVIYRTGSSGEPELYLYNLPYDNPLLFADGNNTYLKAGNEYYQITLIEGTMQKVKPVTDSKLIQRFNR